MGIRGKRKFGALIKDNISQKDINTVMKTVTDQFDEELKDYKYVPNVSELRKGNYIQYIDFDLEDISGGIVVNIVKNYYGTNYLITLKNPYNEIYWKIKSNNYYIFLKQHTTQGGYLHKAISQYLKKFSIDIEDIQE